MTDQGRYVHACEGRTGATRQHLQLTLPASGQPVWLARQVTREALAAWGLAHVEETAVLLVSELVTNAVRHAADTGAIGLELASTSTRLRMEVQDGDPSWREMDSLADCDESGYGFVLIESLAGQWGVHRTMTGKTVWAEIELRER
jgi:anti-sigma regulatory factor (Ser/Thr protein kinase)